MSAPFVDPDEVLSDLKDFQRDTVEYVFRRLYVDRDATDRFLVADEAGLGKTLVARGVIARALQHLRRAGERVDVLYICSNADIARQKHRQAEPDRQGRIRPLVPHYASAHADLGPR